MFGKKKNKVKGLDLNKLANLDLSDLKNALFQKQGHKERPLSLEKALAKKNHMSYVYHCEVVPMVSVEGDTPIDTHIPDRVSYRTTRLFLK